MRFCLIKRHDILNHLCLVLFNDTLFMGLIYDRNDLFLCHSRFLTVYFHAKRHCCQSRYPGNKYRKRFQQIHPEMYQVQISVRISIRMIRTNPAKSQNPNSRKQNHTQCHHQDQCRYMLYVRVKCLYCPWNKERTKANTTRHYDQRNRIDELRWLIDQCHKHLRFLIALICSLLCIILTYISQCRSKSIKDTIQPQQR